MEIDEGVDTIGQTIDLVSEFTLAPLVDVVDGTLGSSNHALDTVQRICAGFLVGRRSDKKQQFVSLHQLTSFGLYGPGLVKAHTGAGIILTILSSPIPQCQPFTLLSSFCTVSTHRRTSDGRPLLHSPSSARISNYRYSILQDPC